MPAPDRLLSALLAPVTAAVAKAINDAYDAGGTETAQKVTSLVNQLGALGVVAQRIYAPEPSPASALDTAASRIASYRNEPLFAMSPQKRGAQNRAAPGVVKNAVEKVIEANPHGLTRDAIRRLATAVMGEKIKEGSLKQSLRLLSKAKKIENRDRLWFPKTDGGPVE